MSQCRREGASKRFVQGLASPAVAAVGAAVFLLLAACTGARADGPSISLSIGSPQPVGSLSFNMAANPNIQPTIPASPASFSVQVVASSTTTWTLEVSAAEAYLDPITRLIPVGNITWSATGTGFVGGTLSVDPQTVASGAGSGTFTGSLSFVMLNEWTYPTGTYSDTITYTATAI